MKKLFSVLSIIAVLIVVAAASSCGKSGGGPTGAPGVVRPAVKSATVDEILNGLSGLSAPDGVDAELFGNLKRELAGSFAKLGKDRFVSAAPTNPQSQVSDLAFVDAGGGNYSLDWHYRNQGDYDQNGEVAIADITPIALNFLNSTTDEGAQDPDLVVDGDGSGEVGISDITPVALNYLVNVAKYVVEGGDVPTGAYNPVGEVVFPTDSAPAYFRQFSYPAGSTLQYQYYRVVPVDSGGNRGIVSNTVPRPAVPGAPSITSVSPLSATPATPVTFNATVTGDPTLSYQWSFGGGAVPDTSTDVAPAVTTAAVGVYQCNLTVTNALGSDSFDFTLDVSNTVVAPSITDVQPQSGDEGAQFQPTATVTGTAPLTYAWDFGGGAVPNTDSSVSPTVTLGAAGSYSATLTVANAAGNDVFPFTLDVVIGTIAPNIVSVSPTLGVEANQITIAANVTGSPPLTYVWDFGGGAVPNTSSDVSPLITLGVAGDYNANLHVSNAIGSDDFPFILHVVPPGQEWTIGSVNPGAAASFLSLAVIGGFPSIAYFDTTSEDLIYMVNSATDGSGTWTAHTADSKGMGMGDVGSYCSLADINGLPGISYYEGGIDFNLKFAICETADGTGLWNTKQVDTSGSVGTDTSLALVGGNPAISYYDADNMDLKYARADNSDGLETWTIVTVDQPNDTGWNTSLAIAGGNPVIGYYETDDAPPNDTHYMIARADTSTGAGTWQAAPIATTNDGFFPYGRALAFLAGRPAAAFFNWNDNHLKFGISPNADGSGAWTISDVDSQTNYRLFVGMAAVGGYPVVGFRDFSVDGLWMAMNNQPDGTGAWTVSEVDATAVQAQYSSIAEVAGRVAIAYWDNSAGDLKFAIRTY